MTTRALMTAAGFIWGATLGIAAAVLAMGIAAGFAWIFMFGDDPWPEWANWAIVGFGIAVGLVVFLICMALARMVARRYDKRQATEKKRGSAVATVLILLGLAVAATYVWQGYEREQALQQQAEIRDAAEAYRSTLAGEVHRITELSVDWPGYGADGAARLWLDGRRAGGYALRWQVRDRLYKEPLVSGERIMVLQGGSARLDVAISSSELVDGYRSLLSRQDANLMVDEPFVFEATLEPVLDEAERAALPEHEANNLRQGWSTLIDRARAEFPVRFFLLGGRLSWDGPTPRGTDAP